MISMGHRKIRCPVCGEEFFVNQNDIDVVHKCINADGTRKTSRNWEDHPEGGLTRVEDFGTRGYNPEPKTVSWSQQKKRLRYNNEVNCYIDLE